MRAPFMTVAVMLLTLSAASDRAAAENNRAALHGAEWRIVELSGQPVPEGIDAHLAFQDDGRMGGKGGCNRIGAGYIARNDGAFLADDAFSTMMLCPEPAMEIEREILDGLRDSRGWIIVDQELELRDSAGGPLIRLLAETQ